MGCPSEVALEGPLVFSITTHDPATAVLTDADADPPYRIYEAETLVPILTGTMSKLDDVNTTGFYTELVACTSAAGFENGKSYTVYITAAVGGDVGGICYGFRVNCTSCGPGATKVIYTLTDSGTGLPIADADIWVTTDIAGANIIAGGRTNALGQVTVWLDSGVTYYVWRQKDGWLFVNPDTEVVP